jgi:6-pyruvoyltetrahydropterin/6-carboxytetrahydropterin synthase
MFGYLQSIEAAMVTCTRRIQFCAGHRVYGHESKCRNLHGHNYVVLFEAEGELDGLGRVVDFSVLKARLGGWIEANWDHGFILFDRDFEGIEAVTRVSGTKVYFMPTNPTAENMAKFLLNVIGVDVLAGTGVNLRSVTVWETENCYAKAVRD